MRKKWLRECLEKNNWNDFFHKETKKRVIKLCNRLGIEFTDDPNMQTEMWAQIGDYLALEQIEFNRDDRGKGRPKKVEDKDVKLAEAVEIIQLEARAEGKKISDIHAIEVLRQQGKIPRHSDDNGLTSKVSRGKKKLEALRYYGAGEDEYTTYDLLRADRDRSCGKLSD